MTADAIQGPVPLSRLLQLASPALPVGAFAYSEGLESAVAEGLVVNYGDAESWIVGGLEDGFARLDLPVFGRLYRAFTDGDIDQARACSHWLRACRDTAETRQSDRDMGQALARLLDQLGVEAAGEWTRWPATTFPTMFALAAVKWSCAREAAAEALGYAWCETRVAAAIKLVPLGQTDGQRLLLTCGTRLPGLVEACINVELDDIAGGMPGVFMGSAAHEVLTTRLFRS